MNNLRRLGNCISIPIPADETAFTGRECPQPGCEGYFKIELGTGLKGKGLPCHCPYCGHTAGHDQFWTKEQIQYAKSVAMRKITEAIHKDFRKLEFDYKPKGAFGMGISMKVKPGHPTSRYHYTEKRLETEIVCVNCTLRYSVYGVFAFCPDCGQHNSLQIIGKNLEVVRKMLDLVAGTDKELAEKLTENALEDCVSVFDGFGREQCRVHANKARKRVRLEKMSFQNLESARTHLRDLFGIDLSAEVAPDEWRAAIMGFQKRHLVAHKMGVVDQDYITKTTDSRAVVGRKIGIGVDEVRELTRIISTLATCVSESLQNLPANL